MEEIEVVGARGFFTAALAVFDAIAIFVMEERLCREDKGAFFTPSDTEARGREAEDLMEVVESAGDTTEARVAALVALVVGFAEVEEDNDGFESGGAVVLGGMTDALRAGPAEAEDETPAAEGREEAMAGLDGWADALVDFLRGEAATVGFAVDAEVTEGLEAEGFTEPEPNVPEFNIYEHMFRIVFLKRIST